MNKKTMINAINSIDEDLIDQYFEIEDNAKKRKKQRGNWIKIATIAACFCLIVTSVAFIVPLLKKPADDITTTPKPSNGFELGVRFLSFYYGKTISADVIMHRVLNPNANLLNGYHYFGVMQYEEDPKAPDGVLGTVTKNRNVQINGCDKKYENKITQDNHLKYHPVDRSLAEFDVFNGGGYQEKVTLDFSDYKPGEIARVYFIYGFSRYTGNTDESFETDPVVGFISRQLNFYIGEDGIAVSANHFEYDDSEYEYAKYNIKTVEIGHAPSPNVCCSAKKIYIKPLTTDICSVPHGNRFVNQYEIISNKEY